MVRGDEFADVLNRRPKYVASRTLHELTWTGSTLLGGDAAAQIAELKREPGKHIMKYGLGKLDETLLAHGLVDELRISLIPVVLGEGRHLLEGSASHPKVELSEIKRFHDGMLRMTYAVATTN